MSLEDLSELERKTYEIIKEAEEIQPKNLPDRMVGAVTNLKNKGLAEIYKKYTSSTEEKETRQSKKVVLYRD